MFDDQGQVLHYGAFGGEIVGKGEASPVWLQAGRLGRSLQSGLLSPAIGIDICLFWIGGSVCSPTMILRLVLVVPGFRLTQLADLGRWHRELFTATLTAYYMVLPRVGWPQRTQLQRCFRKLTLIPRIRRSPAIIEGTAGTLDVNDQLCVIQG